MTAGRIIAGTIAGAALAVAAAGVSAARAPGSPRSAASSAPSRRASPGSFTPSAADPKLAALFARGGLDTSGFRFTPSETRAGRSVTVAVRARSNQQAGGDAARITNAAPTVGLAPIAYNLGVAVGWKRFAVTGDVAKVDLAGAPGSREAADVALSYSANKWTGRVAASADRALPGTPRTLAEPESYALDLGGGPSLTRNLDLTAGMRLKSERERLSRVDDDRRDSQAVYVGAAFRF
ncbi:hypothetical protein AB5I41_21255 [Sphingomonas sp. MMS24-JH45]